MNKRSKKILSCLMVLVIVLLGVVVYCTYMISNNSESLLKINNALKEQLDKAQEELSKPEIIDTTVDDYKGTITVDKLNAMDLKDYNKLMIVTHPDDDMFWGGGHLIEDNYLVVCVTCGMDENRKIEFETVMNATNDRFIELSYPKSVDENLGKEWDFSVGSSVYQDLEKIINLKDWEMIVTHNPDGEYGHKYHIATSQITTSLIKDKSKFYYFGHYYYASQVANLSTEVLSEETYNKKMEIIKYYISQAGSVSYHQQMFHNENFVQYYDWK